MSILLEALRKSEQSRRLGETPNLGTPVEGNASQEGSTERIVPLLLIVLSATVMAWFGWQQLVRPEPVDSTAEPAVVSSREPSEPARVPATVDADAGESRARTPTEDFQARRSTLPSERQELQQSVEEFVAEQDSEPESAPPDAPIVADAEDAVTKLREDQEPPEPAVDPGVKPHIAEPISFWALPQGVRDALPEIRITVLVYAEEPADRFLLSNGQRLVEKDELDSGLVLEEIRRDGAVFTYRKYRFLVKG